MIVGFWFHPHQNSKGIWTLVNWFIIKSKKIFYLHFWHKSNPPGPQTNGKKYFDFGFDFSELFDFKSSKQITEPRRINLSGESVFFNLKFKYCIF